MRFARWPDMERKRAGAAAWQQWLPDEASKRGGGGSPRQSPARSVVAGVPPVVPPETGATISRVYWRELRPAEIIGASSAEHIHMLTTTCGYVAKSCVPRARRTPYAYSYFIDGFYEYS